MTTSYMCFVLVCCVNIFESQGTFKVHQGRYSRGVSSYDVVVPRKVSHSGVFLSHLLPHHYERSRYLGQAEADLRPEDRVHYRLPIGGEDHHLELWPNNGFLSPGMIIERRARAVDNGTLSGVRFEKAPDTQCHYKGRIRGYGGRPSAVSTCYGLTGLIRTKRGTFLIEPVRDHDHTSGEEHPHIIYRHIEEDEDQPSCVTPGITASNLARRLKRTKSRTSGDVADSSTTSASASTTMKGLIAEKSAPLYMETLVVVDKTLLEYHKEFDSENYVLTVMNMAFNMFHDSSFGVLLNLVIVRMITLEEEENELNLVASPDAVKTLDYFCQWQNDMNPGDDTHPNHHDVAVLLTRINICDGGQCGLLGLAKQGGCCDSKYACAIAEDCGLKIGFVIVHELAHTLGAVHDTLQGNGCNGTLRDSHSRTVMDPAISMRTEEWSSCSQAAVRVFIEGGYGACLEDVPADHEWNVFDILPGVMYGGDYQCRTLLFPTAVVCQMGITCESLNCYAPRYGCLQTNIPPAAGTRCGENRWCYKRQCIMVGERPGAVDGGWGEWSEWSECSRTCGSGVSYKVRQCDKPEPTHGGHFCNGDRKKHKICSTEPCEIGQASFRDVQCAEFNDWVYPEDLKTHHWKGFYLHNENPCALFCVDEQHVIASLKPKVVDGTTCYRGIRDICIGGTCREIPCDLQIESKAVEDVCGVCHGDGTECTIREGTRTITKMEKGLRKVVDVPEGTRNIRVEETEPTRAQIAVVAKGTNQFFIKGTTLGMFTVPGSKAWLGMIRAQQEALNIPGPVTSPLSVMVRPRENVTIHFSMGMKAAQKRRPEFFWDYVDWTTCTAQCGRGTQVSIPKCVEKQAGMVEDVYCLDVEKPLVKTRSCEMGPCVARWMIGDWQQCKMDSQNLCKRTRAVKCIKPIGEGEGATDVITDSECSATKPHMEESCSHCRNERSSHKEGGTDWLHKSSSNKSREVTPSPFHKGESVVDWENPAEVRLIIMMEKNDEDTRGEKSQGIPECPANASTWTLEGKDALQFLEKIQEQNTPNKSSGNDVT